MPLLIAAAIAVSALVYGAARFPSSVTASALTDFAAAIVLLIAYFCVGLWARRGPPRVQSALRIGTAAGISLATLGVIYHIAEISTSLPASLAAVLGAGMWGAMFLSSAIACSTTFIEVKSVGIGVLSSAWCGMMYAVALVASALAISFIFMPHMQQILAPVYGQNGVLASEAFVVRHEISAAGEHLLIVPLVASFVGSISAVACILLVSVRRQTALALGIVSMLLFAAGVASIRFATMLERAHRPPYVMFGLFALAVTVACAHPLLVAIVYPRSK